MRKADEKQEISLLWPNKVIAMQQCCFGYPKLRDKKYILACCIYKTY